MRRSRPRTQSASAATERSDEDASPGVLLEVLGDEYTRAALRAVTDQPRSGTEVAELTAMSKPTAFRRLNRLAELGLVRVHQRIDTDGGHHHKVYELARETLEIDVERLFDGEEE